MYNTKEKNYFKKNLSEKKMAIKLPARLTVFFVQMTV